MGGHGSGRPKKYTEKKIKKLREQFVEYMQTAEYPTIIQFCKMFDVSHTMFFSEQFFSDLIKNMKLYQSEALTRMCLKKDKPTGPIFLLKTKHGHVETSNQNINADITLDATIKQMSDKEIDAEIEKLK